jgi:hypothetical protein
VANWVSQCTLQGLSTVAASRLISALFFVVCVGLCAQALVIILVSVFIMFELINWCCARSSAAFVHEK